MKRTIKNVFTFLIAVLILAGSVAAFVVPASAATVSPPDTQFVYLNGYYTDHLYITVTADVVPSFDIRTMPGLTYQERWGYTGDDGVNYMVYNFLVTSGGSKDGIQYTYNFRGSYTPDPDDPSCEEEDYIAYTFYITLYNYSELAPDIGENTDPDIPCTYLYGYVTRLFMAEDSIQNNNVLQVGEEVKEKYYFGWLPYRWLSVKHYNSHCFNPVKTMGFCRELDFDCWSDNPMPDKLTTNYVPDIRLTIEDKARYKAAVKLREKRALASSTPL